MKYRSGSLSGFLVAGFQREPDVLGNWAVVNGAVNVLEEIVLPNSNTFAACEDFLRRIGTWPLYGGRDLLRRSGELTHPCSPEKTQAF